MAARLLLAEDQDDVRSRLPHRLVQERSAVSGEARVAEADERSAPEEGR